ncbi:MAG: hypothetical protein ACE5PV_13905 [Candidatus Poribacteria bacterium]
MTSKKKGTVDQPLSAEKKKAVIDKLSESGKADDIVKAIKQNDIEMYEMNNAVRKKHKLDSDTIALKVGKKIYVNPSENDAVVAAHVAHEGTHVLDKSPNKTKADTLRRQKKGEDVPVEQLVSEPWSAPILFKHTIWVFRNSEIEPPIERYIAVDGSGKTLWLNNPFDTTDFLNFLNSENLKNRLVNKPRMLASILLDLRYGGGFDVLDSLSDIEDIDDEECLRLRKWHTKFTPPQIHSGDSLCLDFWTWSQRTGNLEKWNVEIGSDKVKFNREVLEEHLGLFLPKL